MDFKSDLNLNEVQIIKKSQNNYRGPEVLVSESNQIPPCCVALHLLQSGG